jgi:DNA-binding NtrC family response regulator
LRRILVVDDEKNMCELLRMFLIGEGYQVETANSAAEATRKIKEATTPDLIISDLRLPDTEGLGILDRLKSLNCQVPIVVITAYGTIETAVEAMKQGAVDFITKPFNKAVIRKIIKRIFYIDNLEGQCRIFDETQQGLELVYKSRAMQEIMEMVHKVAAVKSPVLITGESGTGKGLLARTIHELDSDRGSGSYSPFVSINCPSIPDTLLESELFGYQKGAFTGADAEFKGKVRLADGGTLFMDEIADIPLSTQPKLLRLLEDKSFEPLGSTTRTIMVNTRIICATNRELHKLVDTGLFREDLFYRINTITIRIPPLRERREDILPLAEHFCRRISQEVGKKNKRLSKEVMVAFEKYDWPGNAREVRNVIERAIVLSDKDTIMLADVSGVLHRLTEEKTVNSIEQIHQLEKEMIRRKLEDCRWNISEAARELGITRGVLRDRVVKYRL